MANHDAWMVDVTGQGAEPSQEALTEALGTGDIAALMARTSGLSAAVQAFIEASGYVVTDRGGGFGGWHIGVPFRTLPEAVSYVELMTTRFRNAIGARMLRVALKTWSALAWGGKGKPDAEDTGWDDDDDDATPSA